jgi:hypothetical protein
MSLSDLPPELIVQIGSYLEVPDLANLSGVNKRFSSIIDKSNILWKHSLKHFGLNCDPYIERMIRGNFDKLISIKKIVISKFKMLELCTNLCYKTVIPYFFHVYRYGSDGPWDLCYGYMGHGRPMGPCGSGNCSGSILQDHSGPVICTGLV